MRAFIAVDLAPEVKSRISDLIHRLKFAAPRGIGWVKASDIHVTLKFLGEIEESRLAGIRTAVEKAAAAAVFFSLSVRGTGTFPAGSRRPRVLWVGLKESPALLGLQAGLEALLADLGFPLEDRPFKPHLTIGRVKAAPVSPALLDRLAEYGDAAFGETAVRDVVLYRSVLRPQGAEHTVLFRGALRP